jgi:amidase
LGAVIDIVSGHFPGDAYGAPTPHRPFAAEVGADPGKLRIGVLDADPTGQVTVHQDCVRAVAAAANGLARLDHEVASGYPEVLRAGSWPAAFNACLAVLVTRELERFGRLLGRPLTEADVEAATWSYAQAGQHISAVQYVDGIESLRVQARATESWWSEGGWDLLLTPMMPVPALPEPPEGNDASFLALAVALTRFAMPFNISGQPALSLPLFYRDNGTPVGVQLIAPYGREDRLIRIASQLEAAMPWAHRRPQL